MRQRPYPSKNTPRRWCPAGILEEHGEVVDLNGYIGVIVPQEFALHRHPDFTIQCQSVKNSETRINIDEQVDRPIDRNAVEYLVPCRGLSRQDRARAQINGGVRQPGG